MKIILYCTRRLIGIVLIVAVGYTSLYAQVISTLAGNGIAGYSGEGIPADTSKLNAPRSIDVDNAGNLFIAESSNSRIRKINTSGIITTVAGTGVTGTYATEGVSATSSTLSGLNSVAVDAVGNIYFTESLDSRVLKIDAMGIIRKYAGSVTSSGYSGDGGPATAALLSTSITNITTDGAGNVYICDAGNNRVRKVDAAGIITTIAGDGTPGYSGDGAPATNASIRPRAIDVDAVGNIYISDRNYHVVRKITPSGIITTIAGTGTFGYSGDGGLATAAQLNAPEQIRVDSVGNVFICDMSNRRVRMVTPAGMITTVAGNGVTGSAGDGGPATACEFRGVYGIAIRPGCGEHIYVADFNDHRIREIVYYNTLPVFTYGHVHSMSVCPGTLSLDSLLAATDGDVGQPQTWSVAVPAVHGTLSVGYSATSTSGSIIPSGLTYTATSPGLDTFRVIVTDCGNAPDTAIFYITVSDCALFSSFTQADRQTEVFPNPASDELTIKTGNYNFSRFTITNTIGQQLLYQQLTASQTKVDVSMLPAGLYYITLKGEHGNMLKKFIKRK